jgi:hypothetical protein
MEKMAPARPVMVPKHAMLPEYVCSNWVNPARSIQNALAINAPMGCVVKSMIVERVRPVVRVANA